MYNNITESYTYGRGAGFTSRKECNNHSTKGCDKNGLLFYPKCRDHYDSVGCCLCSNDNLIKRFKEVACPVAYNAFNLAGGCKYSNLAVTAGVSACMVEGGGPEDVFFDEPCIELVDEMSALCNSNYQLTQQIACANYTNTTNNFGSCDFFPKIKKTDSQGTNCPPVPDCQKTTFGCCDDKFTSKIDQSGSNCPAACVLSTYGCCSDNLTIKLDENGSNCPTTCLLKYSQCNNKNLECCNDSICRSKDDYYSQCCPTDNSNDECQKWSVYRKTSFSPNCTPKYGNCTNPTIKCCEDSECRTKDVYYSQCCPKNASNDECKNWKLR